MAINSKFELDRASPANARAKLGTHVDELTAALNAANGVIRALVTKLNADAGVTDTNYSSAALADVTKLADR